MSESIEIPSVFEQKITARIEQLKTERDKFLTGANQQLAGFAAAIGELEALLKGPDEIGEATK